MRGDEASVRAPIFVFTFNDCSSCFGDPLGADVTPRYLNVV